jgi:hypothetical protein
VIPWAATIAFIAIVLALCLGATVTACAHRRK